ncbi:hypothetical protein Cni_G19947 [Canna indica]|uniref:Fungal lipase-type domain-containing protein n=1 Tax=Canna indica TaxID=4628 RepID=A0AAQ3KMA6_9LILI|nr:hypothetical protein Cni_G19947 [Canna indica]
MSTEWIANLMSSPTPANLDPQDECRDVKVESGFISMYTSDDSTCRFDHESCREQLLGEVVRLLGKYRDEEMSITLAGHSKSVALAMLLGYDITELRLNRFRLRQEVSVTVYSFGEPRLGNTGFKRRCEELSAKVLRVVNVRDPVTKLPRLFLNENSSWRPWSCASYAHVGVESSPWISSRCRIRRMLIDDGQVGDRQNGDEEIKFAGTARLSEVGITLWIR